MGSRGTSAIDTELARTDRNFRDRATLETKRLDARPDDQASDEEGDDRRDDNETPTDHPLARLRRDSRSGT
jgi:hypothetical protein